ncbi:hypothetical protein OU415_06050 [Saccharopolyspora sp. WRP15-2]|uniref:DUF317 domain-containing protein n=1 Tax=Saccharopolyspora oryzae TaxID=2997343 RepID=A0ABT4UTD8_9PSEU|nr:hypothetical protein [Saccharopolyspora oryzae]MDA3624987.1 hypothetical protein [Saccharopolyspora oryzae]
MQQQGWRTSWNVRKSALKGLPGQPFDRYRRKKIPLALSGFHRGMPAVAMQIDFKYKGLAGGSGPTVYNTNGVALNGSRSVAKWESFSVAVVEMPAPVPELLVDDKRDGLEDFGDLLSLNRSRGVFQGRPTAEVPIIDPATSRKWSSFHVFDASPAYAHAVLTEPRAFWLANSDRGLPEIRGAAGALGFRLSGRKLIVWLQRPLDPAVVDTLLWIADEIMRWIPPAAYQDPAALQADQQHVPLAQLQAQFG